MDISIGTAALTTLALSFVSAIVPWINAEAIVLALPAVAHSPAQLAGLVGIVTIGQMAGKCIVYFAGRRGLALSERSESKGARIGPPAMAERMARWQARAAASPSGAIALLAFSSVVGIPPFYLMSAIAGAVGMHLGWFLVAGTTGRLIRFSALAFGALSLTPNP
jgi:membrane protein YqaA with SNARE-associated domain